jgi:hypothetical protein
VVVAVGESSFVRVVGGILAQMPISFPDMMNIGISFFLMCQKKIFT